MTVISRMVVVILVPALLPVGIPVVAAAPSTSPTTAVPTVPQVVAPNRTIPRPTLPPLRPLFSDPPTQSEITRARVFEEPLTADGHTTARENRALAAALDRYMDAAAPEDLAPLDGFLRAHPRSAWRVALLSNLGLVSHRTGYVTNALDYHQRAWGLGKDATDPSTRALADRAVSEWAWLLTGLGHQGELASLLRELEGRSFSGSSAERILMARQGLALMQARPELAFRCGPVALSRVLLALGYPHDDELAHTPATPRGTSLAQLRGLAESAGAEMHMAKRVANGSPLPAPAVVHFKTGHFAALIERSGERYLVADPVYNEERWISAQALDAETSGYVLAAVLPEGYAPVQEDEAATVWGRSCPSLPDPTQQQPCEDTSGGGGCGSGACAGMADYTFLSLLAALRIQDTPLTYRIPKGPAVSFTLTYNQKEAFQPAVFSYANVGPKWTFDAISYVEDDPSTTAAQTVKVYRRGGGMETYALPAGTAPSPPDFRTRAILVRTTLSPIKYERRMPDGSVETFERPDGGITFPRKVFMTAEADPQGNQLRFLYSDIMQLEALVDALGQVSTLTYADATSLHRVTAITDPFGRTARLTYDAQGRLQSITDTLGLTSSFVYGASDFITSMTTPYGTTTFTTGQNGIRTWIEAEDPLGARERAEYVIVHDSAIGPKHLPASEVPLGFSGYNTNFDAGLTLFWDKRAMLVAPLDVPKAEIKHWLESTLHRPRGIVRAHKKALESRVWYAYQGQAATHGNDGRLIKKGRLLDDPDGPGPLTAPTQAWNFTSNTAGKSCSVIDPLGRETRYTYGTNNVPDATCATGSSIDLLKVEQKRGTAWDVVQQYTYNSQHQPLTAIDGAGKTTTYTYNPAGQVASVTTPPRAGIIEERTTTYTYEPQTGYLLGTVGPGSVDTDYTYDTYGRVRTATNNDDDTLTYDYDIFDRPTRTTHPDGTYEETTYDRLDAARFRDRLGRWSETFYDPLRRVTATRDTANRELHQEWCICGSLSRIVDANGNATSWEHDVQGRPIRENRANGSFSKLTYELTTSRLKLRTDAKGQVTQYTYALDNRQLVRSYSNEEHATADVTVSYTDPSGELDAHGRIRKITDATGETTYSYVPFGQLGAGLVQSINGPLANDTITYGYDELGRVVSRNFDGVTSTWNYDQQWRLASQADPIGTFSYTYHGNTPRLAALVYPNNQSSLYDYHDGLGERRLSQIQHRRPNQAALNTFGYTYDHEGNVKTWVQDYATGGAPEQHELEYDAADQLVAATVKDGWNQTTILKRYRYDYDPAGNRTAEQIDNAVTGATYDDMNRLVSQQPGGALLFRGTTNEPTKVTVQGQPAATTVTNQFSGDAQVAGSGTTNVVVQASDYAAPPNVRTNTYQVSQTGTGKSFTYDANGNLIGDGSRTYEWDAEDRLISVKQGATLVGGFTYDGYGRRSSKTTQVGFESLTYIWDGDEVIQELSSQLNPRRYIRGPGIDNHLAVVEVGGATTYFVADHLGSVVRTTNSAGIPALTRQYDAWGNMLQGSTTNGYAYTGREWDAETGLYYYRARHHNPRMARFLSEDPLGIDAGVNLYAYVLNNPTRFIDPSGEDEEEWDWRRVWNHPANRTRIWTKRVYCLKKYYDCLKKVDAACCRKFPNGSGSQFGMFAFNKETCVSFGNSCCLDQFFVCLLPFSIMSGLPDWDKCSS